MSHHRRLPNGRYDWLDAESLELLRRYEERRLSSTPKPAASSVKTEVRALRSLVLASRLMGGPKTLAALIEDPDTAVKIFRGGRPLKHRTLLTMHSALVRFIRLMVDDPERSQALEERIRNGLYPRAEGRRPPHLVPRTPGGHTRLKRPRPVLSAADLDNIISAARSVSREPHLLVRNQAFWRLPAGQA
jgi:hypothetical protein